MKLLKRVKFYVGFVPLSMGTNFEKHEPTLNLYSSRKLHFSWKILYFIFCKLGFSEIEK